MDPYQRDQTCPACGKIDIKDTFIDMNSTQAEKAKGQSYIRRTCESCGYAWNTIPLYLQKKQ